MHPVPHPRAPAARGPAPGLVAAIMLALLLGACGQQPTPTPELPRGTALPPPGVTLQPAR